MRIAHINVTATLSTGRIAADLCRLSIRQGHEALLCYGRGNAPVDIPTLRVGDLLPDPEEHRRGAIAKSLRRLRRRVRLGSASMGVRIHAGLSRITDRAGFYSRHTTRRFIRQLELWQPDLIHLHNIHGYYLHLPTLMDYLRRTQVPVVWTLHDSWAYTGHCAYYQFPVEPFLRSRNDTAKPLRQRNSKPSACLKWQEGCSRCPLKRTYPASWLLDRSTRNYKDKKALFSGLPHITLVTPSQWLADEVRRSFLSQYPVYAMPNGIDLSLYAPCDDARFMQETAVFYGLDQVGERKLVLSVAAVWDERKGLADLVELARALGDGYCVAAVGLTQRQIDALPYYMLGLPRTRNVRDLCVLYTAADVYVSMSQGETMGMTLVEAMACGTQVLCYQSTAMPELITPRCGETVPVGDIDAAVRAVKQLCQNPRDPLFCIGRAAEYGMNLRYEKYMELYRSMESGQPFDPRLLPDWAKDAPC